MRKLNKIKLMFLGTIFLEAFSTPLLADNHYPDEGLESRVFRASTAEVIKALGRNSYDNLFQQSVNESKNKVLKIAETRFKQIFWREGNLAALDSQGNYTPVVHQYKDFKDWVLHYALGNTERKILTTVIDAAGWYYEFDKKLEKALKKTFGVGNLDDFVKLMGSRVIDTLTAPVPSVSQSTVVKSVPKSTPSSLTRKQILEIENTLSSQTGRAEAIKTSQENWDMKDWVGYIFYNLSMRINKHAEHTINYIQEIFEHHIIEVEDKVVKQAVIMVGGGLGSVLHPVIGIGVGTFVNHQNISVPSAVKNYQHNLLVAQLKKAALNFTPPIKIEEEQIRKYDNQVLTHETVSITIEGEEFEFDLINQESINPIDSIRSQWVKRVGNKVRENIALPYSEGASKAKKTKTFAGQKISYKKRSAPLLGMLNVAKNGSNKLLSMISSGFWK